MNPIILDTDIGTDIDDQLALTLALQSPEVNLLGVTTVYANTELRTRMVRKLLDLAGRTDIPVAAGVSRTLMGKRKLFWEGHEGVGLLTEQDANLRGIDRHAVDFIIEQVMARPGEVTLVAIGPLTNVALAVVKEPRLAQSLHELVIMGGSFRTTGFNLPVAEHNIICDPEAASIVFSSGAHMTVVPLDVTTQVRVRRQDVEQLKTHASPLIQAAADQLDRYITAKQRDWTHLHDPLALAMTIDPSFCQTTPLHITVETCGELTAGQTIGYAPSEQRPATANVALQVDARRFEQFFVQRLMSPRL